MTFGGSWQSAESRWILTMEPLPSQNIGENLSEERNSIIRNEPTKFGFVNWILRVSLPVTLVEWYDVAGVIVQRRLQWFWKRNRRGSSRVCMWERNRETERGLGVGVWLGGERRKRGGGGSILDLRSNGHNHLNNYNLWLRSSPGVSWEVDRSKTRY